MTPEVVGQIYLAVIQVANMVVACLRFLSTKTGVEGAVDTPEVGE